jgi:hypothetical protein
MKYGCDLWNINENIEDLEEYKTTLEKVIDINEDEIYLWFNKKN